MAFKAPAFTSLISPMLDLVSKAKVWRKARGEVLGQTEKDMGLQSLFVLLFSPVMSRVHQKPEQLQMLKTKKKILATPRNCAPPTSIFKYIQLLAFRSLGHGKQLRALSQQNAPPPPRVSSGEDAPLAREPEIGWPAHGTKRPRQRNNHSRDLL